MKHNVAALVVDDNEINLLIAQEMLRSLSADVDLAASGGKAVEMCRLRHYDIILMDHLMPDMDGVEATKRIRTFTGTPVVAMTANDDPSARSYFAENGFAGFLQKPLEAEHITELFAKLVPHKPINTARPETAEHVLFEELSSAYGLDYQRPLKVLGGNMSAYLNILRAFVQVCPSKIRQMEEMVDTRNWEDFRIAIHGQKGALANIGAPELVEQASAMEKSAKNKEYEGIPEAFEIFRKKYTALCEAMGAIWQTGAPPEKKADTSEWQQLPKGLHQIDTHLKHLEQDEAFDVLKPLLSVKFNKTIDEDLIALRDAIDAFDYDRAAELIMQLLKGMPL